MVSEYVQFSPFIIPYVIAVAISGILVVYTYRYNRNHGADPVRRTFFWFICSTFIWSFTRTMQLSTPHEELKLFWITLLYIGYGGTAVWCLAFALSFTGRASLLTRRFLVVISLPPALAVVLAGTNEIHGLMWTYELITVGDRVYIEREFKSLFLVLFVYAAGSYWISMFLFVRMALGAQSVYRNQSIATVVGIFFPMVAGHMYALEINVFFSRNIDLTPLGIAICGIFFSYSIFRYELLDLVPVARKTVVENMREGYIVLDTKDRVIDLNSAAKSFIPDDTKFTGEKLTTLMPLASEIVADHEHGTQVETEFTVSTDGDQQFLAATVSSLYDDELIGRLMILRDITDRHAIQKRYQALIENSSDLILVLDEGGRITYASPSIRNVTGVSPDMVEGKNTFDLVHYDDVETLRGVFDDLLADSGDKIRFEYRTIDADGEIVVMEGVGQNMLANPFVEGIVVNARDITERKERERELERTNDQLQQFASVVSHDLRNPLNVARGHLQIAAETGDEESLDEIEVSLDRMEAIIGDVLTLAKQGQPIGETEPVSLESLAGDAWTHVATDEATLVVADDPTFEADPDRLLQLFENLFRNAHEHVGEDVTVTVGFDEDGESIYVEDDGPGIPEDHRDEVFESGFTTNEDGTGFGLSIVTQIAEAHGWDVAVAKGTAGGARFEFQGVDDVVSTGSTASTASAQSN